MAKRTSRTRAVPARKASVGRSAHNGIQYEFYMPASIWDHPAARRFRSRLLSIQGGGTILNGATGVWEGDTEQTRIFRVILHSQARFNAEYVRKAIQTEVHDLMAGLADSAAAQSSFMYTECPLRVLIAGETL